MSCAKRFWIAEPLAHHLLSQRLACSDVAVPLVSWKAYYRLIYDEPKTLPFFCLYTAIARVLTFCFKGTSK
jgi:hypothetical protein